jgi:hypothetical protein
MTIPMDLCHHLGLIAGTRFYMVYDGHGKLVIDLTTGEKSKLFDPPTPASVPEPVVAA